jgi:hypothetical protein
MLNIKKYRYISGEQEVKTAISYKLFTGNK